MPEPSDAIEREVVRALRTGRAAMPVLPAVAQAALRLANDPAARLEEMVRLVDSDPPIAARFMSVANAVSFFRGTLATSTRSAIVRLGIANTRDLLFQVVYAHSAGDVQRYQGEVKASFERSVATAMASRVASRALGLRVELDYMCGLLHDIGEARIYRVLDEISTSILGHDDVARVVFKYHAIAGAEIAEAWKLPSPIVEACAYHHDARAVELEHVRLVMIADVIVRGLEDGPSKGDTTAAAQLLGMDDDEISSMTEKTRAAMRGEQPPK